MPMYQHLFAVLIVALWGGNYVASKVGMEFFPAIFYTGLRFWLTALVLLPFLPKPGDVHASIGVQKKIFLIAVVLCVGHMAFILVAMQMGLNIAATTLIVELGVPISCIMGVIFFGEKIGRWRMLGIIISLAGVGMLHGSPNVMAHMDAFFIALAAVFAWSTSNVMMKKLPQMSPLRMFAMMSLYALPMLIGVSYLLEFERWPSLLEAPLSAWLGLCYTVLCSTIIAYGGWAHLITKHEVSTVAPYSLLVPLWGMLAGWAWYGEVPSREMLLGGAVILFGVAIIVFRRPRLLSKGGAAV